MYTFSIKKDIFPIVEITIDDEIIKESIYFQSLIEKCFEKVFHIINSKVDKEIVLEEVDLEEEDD